MGDGKRKLPKVGASTVRHDEGTDDEMVDATSQPASPRVSFRPSRSRPTRASRAPPPAQADLAELFVLVKLPEPVSDSVALKWFDGISARLGDSFVPARSVFLPFHDHIAVQFERRCLDSTQVQATVHVASGQL